MKNKIAPDKWKHFWVGIPLGAVLQFAGLYYFSQWFVAILAAFIFLVVICYGFELFSMITRLGHYDLMDAVAGILGGAIGIGMIVVLKLLEVF